MFGAGSSEELVRLQLGLECIGVTPDGVLIRIDGPDPDDIPLFYAVRHEQGYAAYPRDDLPSQTVEHLRSLPPEVALDEPQTGQAILAEFGPCMTGRHGKAYLFPPAPYEGDSPDVARLGRDDRALLEQFDPGFAALAERRSVFAAVVKGKVVSACVSVREDERAGEA